MVLLVVVLDSRQSVSDIRRSGFWAGWSRGASYFVGAQRVSSALDRSRRLAPLEDESRRCIAVVSCCSMLGGRLSS
jgi:hypothetical protein